MTPSHSTPSAAHKPRTALQRASPFLAIVLFSIAILYRMVLFGEALYWGDIALYFQPLEEVVKNSLHGGHIPLWNPYVLCGQPLVGNPQTWVFYPTTALLGFMPVWLYFTINTLLHLILAGFGTYLYLRRVCGDRLGAVLGAITYIGSGFLIARIQFPTMIQSAAYLPWLLLLIDRIIDKPRIWHGALLALIVALELLAAHTQLAYMTFACGTVYALAKLYKIRKHRPRAKKAFWLMASAFVVGLAGAFVQLLPTLQLFGLSTRGHLTWSQANRFVLRPGELINFLLPNYYGNPSRGDFWGEGNLWEPCVYLGILPLVLAVYAMYRGNTRPAVRFFTVAGLVSLWLAMGKFGGLFWIAFYVVPGIASFHDPARFAFIMTFAFTVLAAIGLRVLRDRGLQDRYRLGIVVLSAVNLWAFSAHLNPTINPVAFTYRPRVMSYAPEAGEGRVFTALRDRVWQRYLNYSDYGPDSARYIHELTDTLAPNIGMRFGVEEGSGYEPVPLRSITEVDGLVRIAIDRQTPNLPLLLGLFNAHTLLLPQSTRYRHPALKQEQARGVTAFTMREPFPRAWLVRQTKRIEGSQRTLMTLTSPDFDPRKLAIVSGSNGLGSNSLFAVSAQMKPVDVRATDPGMTEMSVDCGSEPAFLVWSSTAYPGWKCTDNGRPVRLERTNHAFIGIALSGGAHQIKIRYEPASYLVGLYITLVSVLSIISGLTYGLVLRPAERRKRVNKRGKDRFSE